MKKPEFSPEKFKLYRMDIYNMGSMKEEEILARIAESIFDEWLEKQPVLYNTGNSIWIDKNAATKYDQYIARIVDIRALNEGNN